MDKEIKEQVNALKKEYDALKQELKEIKELMHKRQPTDKENDND